MLIMQLDGVDGASTEPEALNLTSSTAVPNLCTPVLTKNAPYTVLLCLCMLCQADDML